MKSWGGEKEKRESNILDSKVASDLGKPWAGRGALAAAVGGVSQALPTPPCPAQDLPFPLTAPHRPPDMLLVTCGSQHCHLLLFLVFSSYARSCEVKEETEKQFSLLRYQAALCWITLLLLVMIAQKLVDISTAKRATE